MIVCERVTESQCVAVAQLVEHRPGKPEVRGLSPASHVFAKRVIPFRRAGVVVEYIPMSWVGGAQRLDIVISIVSIGCHDN